MKYGLSFIKLHSPPELDEATPSSAMPTSVPVPTKLGGFSLKEETKDLPSGSLFFKRGLLSSPPGKGAGTGVLSDCPNAAAQARMASAAALRGITSSPPVSAQGPNMASPVSAHPHTTTSSPVSVHPHHKTTSSRSPKAGPSGVGGTSSRGNGGSGGDRGGVGGGGNKRPMTTAHTTTPGLKRLRGE